MTKAIASTAAAFAVLGLVAMSFVSAIPAHAAMTTAEMEALIAQLQAQLAGTSTTTTGAFTTDLTVGSKGASVTALQNWLIGKGFSIAAGATGTFGPQTKAALAAYQTSAGITPAAGYFGPVTRAKVNAAAGTTTTTTGSTGMTGTGEGYLSTETNLSQYNSETVGEGEADVKVLGKQFKAEGADQKIERVTVTIDTPTTGSGTASTRLEKTVDNVAVLLDGKVLGRMNVADATRTSSSNLYTFRFTGLSGVIKKGMKGDLTVAVTGASGVTAYKGNGWTVHLGTDAIRAVSPNGVDDTYGTANSTTFTVNTYASANSVELQAAVAGTNPDATSVKVDATNDTTDVTLLKFTLKAKGSDINITELPVTLTVAGASDVDYVTNTLNLKVNGDTYSETVSTPGVTSATVTFDNLDLDISAGDTLDFTVTADINNLDSNFTAGTTLAASVSGTNMDYVKATDQTDEDLAASALTGTATGNAMAFYATGPGVAFSSASTSVIAGGNNSYDDTGTFTIKYKVTAFGGDIYVSTTATATTATTLTGTPAAGVYFLVDKSGTATAAATGVIAVNKISGTVTSSGLTNEYKITEGSVAEVVLTVQKVNGAVADTGLYRASLKGLTWGTAAATETNLYNLNLTDYHTDYVSVN